MCVGSAWFETRLPIASSKKCHVMVVLNHLKDHKEMRQLGARDDGGW